MMNRCPSQDWDRHCREMDPDRSGEAETPEQLAAMAREYGYESEGDLLYSDDVPAVSPERMKRIDALFWEKFRQAYPDHPWLKLRERKDAEAA